MHQNRKSKISDELVFKVNAIVEANCDNHLFSKSDIAGQLNLISTYVGREYKSATFTSLNDYITENRLERSKSVLMNCNKPIKEIAKKLDLLLEITTI